MQLEQEQDDDYVINMKYDEIKRRTQQQLKKKLFSPLN